MCLSSRRRKREVLTWRKCGNGARISDEYIKLPKAPKHALHSAPHGLYVAHVRSKNEHIRARHVRENQVFRLFEGIPGACQDCHRSARTRILQRSLAPDATRCARDENNFSAVGLGGI